MDDPKNQSQLPATGYELPEDSFKADAKACDRYISFSSELLRLSLIGIGAYGTLATYFFEHHDDHFAAFKCSRALFASAVIFALCTGATLVHRFWASESMTCYVAYLRAIVRKEAEKRKHQDSEFHKALGYATMALIIAEFLFALAVATFIAGIYQLVFIYWK